MAPAAVEAPVRHPFILRAADENNPLRKLAFFFSLGLLLVRLGVIPELIAYLTGTNTYLLYLMAPPSIVGAMLTGGLRRTFQRRAAYYWVAFFVWMMLATTVSEWRGGSAHRVIEYGRIEIMMVFVLGGLAVNWKELRLIFYTIAAAGLLNVVTVRLFLNMANTDQSRISLNVVGTIGNSNDLAAQLLLVLPFILFIAMDPRRNLFVRIAIVGPIVYAIWVILGTASRGALIALITMACFALWRASMSQKIVLLAASLALVVIVSVTLPRVTLDRLNTLFGKQYEEADDSAASRSYLFKQSVRFTLEHPIFGVGPDQFPNHEGHMKVAAGEVGNWHATHCTWTQVSSECGIPAMIFYILGVGSALHLVNRVYRTARAEGNIEIANACFCYLMAMTGFVVAMTFLASAYRFYFPLMIGLAIAISLVANQQRNARAIVQARAPRAGLLPRAVSL